MSDFMEQDNTKTTARILQQTHLSRFRPSPVSKEHPTRPSHRNAIYSRFNFAAWSRSWLFLCWLFFFFFFFWGLAFGRARNLSVQNYWNRQFSHLELVPTPVYIENEGEGALREIRDGWKSWDYIVNPLQKEWDGHAMETYGHAWMEDRWLPLAFG